MDGVIVLWGGKTQPDHCPHFQQRGETDGRDVSNDNDNDNVNDNDNDARPGVWSSPDNILALYKAVQTFISQHSQKQNQNGEKYDGNGNIFYKYSDCFSATRSTPDGREDKKVIVEIPKPKQVHF